MGSPLTSQGQRPRSALLKLHDPGPGPAPAVIPQATWMINGFPAHVLLFSPEDWAETHPKPADAQLYSNGYRVALRMA